MLKRILYTLLSVLLLSLPWLGGSALTLFVAFVPLLWVEHSLAGQTGRRGKPRRFWPYVVSAFVLWWLATVWWVGYAAVIGVVRLRSSAPRRCRSCFWSIMRYSGARAGAGLYGACERLDRL